MEMSTEKKKELLAQFGPQCGNGNCEGPPKCLLRHSKPSKQSKETKQYVPRKVTRSRSNSMLEGRENQTTDVRPRSNSTTLSVDALANYEEDIELVLAMSASEQTVQNNVKRAEEEEEEVSKAIKKSVEEKDGADVIDTAEKAEGAIMDLAVAKSLEDVECDKAEEAVVDLAVAKSLEETCTFCKETFPGVDEAQLHILQSHTDEHDGQNKTPNETKTTATEQIEGGKEEKRDLGVDLDPCNDNCPANEERRNDIEAPEPEEDSQAGQETGEEIQNLRDEVQQLKNTVKVMQVHLDEKEAALNDLEDKVGKLE